MQEESINFKNVEFGNNDAILDWKILRGAEAPFSGITSLSDVLSFFSLVEAVAIYDVLWVADADIKYLDTLKPLVDAHILKSSPVIPDKLSNPDIKESFQKVSNLLRHGSMARLSEVNAMDQSNEATYARFLFAEKTNLDAVLDPVLTSYVPLVKAEKRKSIAARLSGTLSNIYEKEINELIAIGSPIPFYIPPAPAVILDRSGDQRNKIIQELLNLREEFSQFRQKYRQYQMIIRNPSIYTPIELSQAVEEGLHEVEIALKQITKKKTHSRLISEVFDVNVATSLDDISIDKPLGSLVKSLVNSVKTNIVRGRAQCLFDLWNAAMSIRGYESLLQRHFDLEDSALSQDLDLIQKLGDWVDAQANIKR